VEDSDAHPTANYETERKLNKRVGLGGGLRLSRGAKQIPQQLPAHAREKGDRAGADVRIPKKDDGRTGLDFAKSEKLVLTLEDKSSNYYAVHYNNLQFYLSQGLRLKKVHRVIECNQELWMEPYIQMNTEFRKEAKSEFETNFYKLMKNSVFGKTMENLRNCIDMKIIPSWKTDKIQRLVASPSYERHEIFGNDLVGMHKTRLILDKPIYTGMTI